MIKVTKREKVFITKIQTGFRKKMGGNKLQIWEEKSGWDPVRGVTKQKGVKLEEMGMRQKLKLGWKIGFSKTKTVPFWSKRRKKLKS